jgi:WD40 repeat protein
VSVHNALNQHQPIKMLEVDFAPEGTGVRFSENSEVVGVIGNQSLQVNIYDTVSFTRIHCVQIAGQALSDFYIKNRQIVVATIDAKIRVFDLNCIEGTQSREIISAHRGGLTSINLSNNQKYWMTGGEDQIIKIWDSSANKSSPYYFQSFIGHTQSITTAMMNPDNNQQAISLAGKDGILIWKFNGDQTFDLEAH